jgi:hypothetical protein
VRRLLRSLAAFVLLCALVPALWLAHNYAINGKPLDWWNGPYSAKAIEQRNVGEPPHPGSGSVRVSALYFVKAAKLNFAQGRWQGWMLALAVFGTLSHGGPLLLLWLPLPFYAYAIAYGSVPIFLPVWYPFSYYNARYGLELLPAFAVFAALAVAFVYELSDRSTSQLFPRSAPKDWARDVPPQQTQKRHLLGTPDLGHPNPHGKWGTASAVVATALVIMLAANYLRIAGATPICLREARANSAARLRLQAQLAETLRRLPPGSIMLMYTGEYVGALQAADVPLRRVVSEATEATELVWDAGLSCPAQVADYVVAIGGDPVAEAVKRNPRWLEKVAAFSTPGKPDVTVYRSRFPGRRSISDF